MLSGVSRARAWRRRAPFLLALAAAVVAELFALFAPTSEFGAAGRRPYVIERFSRAEPVGQTFAAGDGLESVDVELSSTEPAVVDLAWRLLGAAPGAVGNWAVIYSGERRLQVPRGRMWHRFAFGPIFPSAEKVYQFQMEQRGIRPADARSPRVPVVGVMASADDALPAGNVVIGAHQDIHHDLFFKARTASSFRRFHVHANPLLPQPLRNTFVQLVLLALGTWMLAVFAFEMTVRGPERDSA